LKIGPPFKKTALNLSPAESSDLDKIMQVYDDAELIKAMENYEKIKKSVEHDLGNCVYRGFANFMIRGAEKFCDEANPFELFRRKGNGTTWPPEKTTRFNLAQTAEQTERFLEEQARYREQATRDGDLAGDFRKNLREKLNLKETPIEDIEF
jgi:hypothetical protein